MSALRIMRASSILAVRERVTHDVSFLQQYVDAAEFTGIAEQDLVNTAIEVTGAAPALVTAEGNPQKVASTDAENAILVYSYLPQLTRAQAADERLWITLAHTTYWTYVRARWGEQEIDKVRNTVLLHWFVPRIGKASLRSQAISRLWWAAHLTSAPWERDPELEVFRTADRFRFTRILLSRQQIFVDLVERNYGSDLRIRTCILDALDRYMPSVRWKDGLSRETSKQLNLLLKHRLLASLAIGQLKDTCESIVSDVAIRIGRDDAQTR